MVDTKDSMGTIWASEGGGEPKQGGGSKGDGKSIEPVREEGGGTPDQGGGTKGDGQKEVPPVRES